MQAPIYLIGNKTFKGIHTLPLNLTHFITPNKQDWIKALYIHDIDMAHLSLALNDVFFILTSQKAILALNHLRISLQGKKAFVVGASTQKIFEEHGGEVIGRPNNAYGEEMIKIIQQVMPKNQKAIYFRAQKSLQDIAAKLCHLGYCVGDIILYKTRENPKQFDPPPPHSIIIFAAPSSYHTFFKRFKWDTTWKAIAIGKSTFHAFHDSIQKNAFTSPNQTLEACIDLAYTLAI